MANASFLELPHAFYNQKLVEVKKSLEDDPGFGVDRDLEKSRRKM
jgi:hypothetical protein